MAFVFLVRDLIHHLEYLPRRETPMLRWVRARRKRDVKWSTLAALTTRTSWSCSTEVSTWRSSMKKLPFTQSAEPGWPTNLDNLLSELRFFCHMLKIFITKLIWYFWSRQRLWNFELTKVTPIKFQTAVVWQWRRVWLLGLRWRRFGETCAKDASSCHQNWGTFQGSSTTSLETKRWLHS